MTAESDPGRARTGKPVRAFALLGLVLAMLGAGVVLHRVTTTTAAPPSRNLILISMDTTRADHLACYGYQSIRTPHIDRIAERGTVFLRAFATAPVTAPSHASILTGTYPPYHQVRDNGMATLPQTVPTMAELFRAKGHQTAGIVAAFPLKGVFGFRRGFDYFSDSFEAPSEELIITNLISIGMERRKGEVIAEEFGHWLAVNGNRPFFAWLHFFDPHLPYDRVEPFFELYPEQHYDAEIAYVDDCLGEVMRSVARAGLDDRTGYIVVGDHGEGLMEHNELTHALLTYNTTMRVPLVMSFPWLDHALNQVEQNVSIVDILPTVIELFGLTSDPDRLQLHGVSLASVMQGTGDLDERRTLYFESMFPRYHFSWGELTGIVEGRWKYIKGPDDELYDIRADFDELDPLDDRTTTERLAGELGRLSEAIARARPVAEKMPVDREVQAKLAALGYLGSGSEPDESSPDTSAERPVPRENMDLYFLYNRALVEFRSGAFRAAKGTCRQMLERNPHNRDARMMLAGAHAALHELDEADAEFRLLIIERDDPDVLYRAAQFFLVVNRDFELAEQCLQKVLGQNPQDWESMVMMGDLCLRRGETARAVELYRTALALNATCRDALVKLAVVLDTQYQDDDEAEELLRTAVARFPFDSVTNFNLGIFLARHGRTAEGISFLERASVFSSDRMFGPSHFALASVYLEQGEAERAASVLREVVLEARDPQTLSEAQALLAEIE